MQELTDQQLILDYLSGDEESFALLLDRHLALVVNFAGTIVKNRQVAEDISQEVFLKVWRNLPKFKSDGNFKTWLLVITKNTCLDYLRKQKIELSNVMSFDAPDESMPEVASTDELPDETFFKKELREMLDGILRDFSEAEKLIVTLHYYEQLTFEEIAEILDQSVNTVKSRHRRLMIKLREKMA